MLCIILVDIHPQLCTILPSKHLEDTRMSIQDAIDFLLENSVYLNAKHEQSLAELMGKIGVKYEIQGVEDFSIMDEVKLQMQVVRNLRRNIEGRETTSRELKDLASASTQLFSMLTKMKSEIDNQDWVRKVEDAVVEVIGELDEKTQAKFYARLEKELP
jgi:hypothetical protein